ncbi:MAG: EpsG family protein [Odoribacter splanchnicus]
MYSYLLLFAIWTVLCFVFDFTKNNRIPFIYFLLCIICFVGFRGSAGIDSPAYIDFWENNTDTFWNWKEVEKGYNEFGFYYLSVILKSIVDNIDFYFFSVSVLTIYFLYKAIDYFCVYPFLGFLVYISRFLFFRDMNQIRSAIAIAMIIYSLKFLVTHKYFRYWIVSLFAFLMHYSVIVAGISRFFHVKLSFRKMLYVLLFSFIGGGLIGIVFKPLIVQIDSIKLLTYLNVDDLGLKNPMIYFQIVLCLLFFGFENQISSFQKGYNIIRNAYLFSTVTLLLTANLGIIGGRLATIFATCEIFMVPALARIISPKLLGYILAVVMLTMIFYLNYRRMFLDYDRWYYLF